MREKMEEYLRRNFDVEPKRPSEEALKRWRSAVSVIKNPTRRFRMVADLAKRAEDKRKRKSLQEKIRVAIYVQKAALQFIDAGNRGDYNLPKEVKDAGFGIDPEEIASFARSHDTKGLEGHGGVSGLAGEVSVSLEDGVVSSKIPIRQDIYGFNRYAEKPSKGFGMYLWEAVQDLTLIILMVAAAVSIGVGIATEGMPKVPEGLPLAVTLSLAFAMKKLMFDKALVRHLSACETMGSATCICTDKTGTLTTNHMVVNKIWVCNETETITSNDNNDVLKSASEGVHDLLLQSIFLNTSAEVVKGEDGKNSIMGTPTETAVFEFGMLLGGDFKSYSEDYKILTVEPFNSVRKKMSVLVALPDGGKKRAFCKGASEIIFKMCDNVVATHGEAVPLSDEQRTNISNVINGFACEALRTLCLAFKNVYDSSSEDSIPDDKYTLIAVVGIKDPVRPGVREAVKTCLEAGITVRMVTGDNINTAKAIAKECGILTEDGLAIEGPDFQNKSSQEMAEIIPKLQVMARSLPLDKHTLVKQLRNELREVVAVTGDGANDAPALHEADIGLAMGIAGTELTGSDANSVLNTVIFNSFVFCQVFNEINSRHMEKINVFSGMFSSYTFMMVMISTVVFQIIIVEFLGKFAQTVPLSWKLWLISVLIGAVSLLVAVVLKFIPVSVRKQEASRDHEDVYEPLLRGPDLA
ncbi:hypothetical protein C1H46_025293 [Malus baccata]|uniref:P-type Cu(+) transporter n=1 Tax=Malus baccata TaxID=106549 RepID=A0A540LRQ8_MALBA|nr:hypothetical protein C1H46_025293 [Malus baccata]